MISILILEISTLSYSAKIWILVNLCVWTRNKKHRFRKNVSGEWKFTLHKEWSFPFQETADLVTFTEEILNGKLHILCSVSHILTHFWSMLPCYKLLTYFMSLVCSYSPWKHQETFGFLMFSGGTGRDQWHEMG